MSMKKKDITYREFQNLLKSHPILNIIEKELSELDIKCKKVWQEFFKINNELDILLEQEFGEINKLEKLSKKSNDLYLEWQECGEIEQRLNYEKEEIIEELNNRVNIIYPKTIVMTIRSGAGLRRKKFYTKKNKAKINRRKNK